MAATLLLGLSLRATPLGAGQDAAVPVLEYIAHASFVVQSSSGVRVAIDPFNSERWLGLAYPARVSADAVLVSHPHYDHDASYYFPAGTPVFRRPGRYAVGDIRIEGYEGRHAGAFGLDFGQVNTIWVVETGGVRLAHLGDNGPVPAATLEALGRIDVLLAPGDAQKHILSDDALAAARTTLAPRVTIPMHYRHAGFLELPASLGPAAVAGAEAWPAHRFTLDRAALATPGRVVMLKPSPEVEAWSRPLADAWRLRDGAPVLAAAIKDPMRAGRPRVEALRQAATLVPAVIIFQVELAETLVAMDEYGEARSILERALAAAARQDVEYTMRARMLLADLYVRAGQSDLAAAQYRVVAADSSRAAQVREATAHLERLISRPAP
ncbi:MAG TPA: MBL fold metallo-hydrolase [Vicinamibacterales bacterium]|nr:MBL fold metallo-hydrolase [Vicinamibacterales bacterium]